MLFLQSLEARLKLLSCKRYLQLIYHLGKNQKNPPALHIDNTTHVCARTNRSFLYIDYGAASSAETLNPPVLKNTVTCLGAPIRVVVSRPTFKDILKHSTEIAPFIVRVTFQTHL